MMQQLTDVERQILLYCVVNSPNTVAMIASGYHTLLISELKRIGCDVDAYDRDPYLNYGYIHADPVFEDCNLSRYDLIVNMSAEKMYPLAKIYPGMYILVFSKVISERDCTTPDSNNYINVEERYNLRNKVVLIGHSQ